MQSTYPIYRHRKACLSKQPLWRAAGDPARRRSRVPAPAPAGALRALFFYTLPSFLLWESFFSTFSTNPANTRGSKSPCNHLFSLHMGAFVQRWQCLHQVWTFCLSCHVTWTVLHAWFHYSISIKTMHFGHYWLSKIGGKFELRENHVVAF